VTYVMSPGATLTGNRITLKWPFTFTLPAPRYLGEFSNSVRVTHLSHPRSEEWTTSARRRLDELADLRLGWDGASAQPISSDAISSAMAFLSSSLVANLETKPDLVPTYEGALLIEWHTEAIDLIIELGPAGSSFYVCDNLSRSEVEGMVRDYLEVLASAFVKLGFHP